MVAVSSPSHRVLAIGTRLWGRHLRYLQRVEYWVEPRDVEVSSRVLSPLCVTGMTILMIVLRRRPFHDLIAGTDVAYELEHGVTSVSAKRGWSKAAKIAGASLSAATIVAVVALVWAWTGAHPHDLSAREQQAYIQDNRGILDSLPQLPGSERLDLRSNPYCTNGAIVGVATTEPVSNAAENAKPRRRGLLRPYH